MTQRIIYQTEDGGVAIIVPAFECGLTIEEIAQKDVPAGFPYAIVDTNSIPSDRTFRSAWEVEQSNLSDGIGIGQDAWFAIKAQESQQ